MSHQKLNLIDVTEHTWKKNKKSRWPEQNLMHCVPDTIDALFLSTMTLVWERCSYQLSKNNQIHVINNKNWTLYEGYHVVCYCTACRGNHLLRAQIISFKINQFLTLLYLSCWLILKCQKFTWKGSNIINWLKQLLQELTVHICFQSTYSHWCEWYIPRDRSKYC